MDSDQDTIVSKEVGDEETTVQNAKKTDQGTSVQNVKRSYELFESNQKPTTAVQRNTSLTDKENIYYGPISTSATTWNYVERIRNYCEDNKVFHEYQWREKIQTSKEAAEIHRKLSMRGNYRKIVGSAIENARLIVPRGSYKERLVALDHVKVDPTEYYEAFKTFEKIILHNKVNMTSVFKCLCGELGKRRTVYLLGEANSGKSSLLNMLSAIYETHEIGKITAQDIQSNFWLQDLVDKELYVGDEILVSQVNVDTVKLLCEGNRNLCTEIKYGNKQLLPARPVMIANNVDMCQNVQAHGDAINARCVKYRFTTPPGGLGNITQNQDVLRNVLKTLWEIYV